MTVTDFVATFDQTNEVSFHTQGQCAVDWGDGTVTSDNSGPHVSHQYETSGTWQVRISGQMNYLNMFHPSLTEVLQWGDLGLVSAHQMFQYCPNLVRVPNCTDGLEHVTDMSQMFAHATKMNCPLDRWDMSNVTTTNGMFWDASSFNHPIGAWDMSKVLDLCWMFRNAHQFLQDLSGWQVNPAADYRLMFPGTAMCATLLPGPAAAAVAATNFVLTVDVDLIEEFTP